MSETTLTAHDHGADRMSSRLHNWRRGMYRFRQSWTSTMGLTIIVVLLVLTLAGPFIVPYPEHVLGAIDPAKRFMPPSVTYWFGTNEMGQDVLSLVIAGARISLLSAIAIVTFSAVIGTIIGGIAGLVTGIVDEALMRFVDFMLTVPQLILAMAIASAWGPGILNMILAVTIASWPGYARLVRGEVISHKERPYVTVARAMGASTSRILFTHILPNVASPIVVKFSLDIGFAILTIASLGFIGIGVRPPTPEWGTLLSQARGYMPAYWWVAIFPGLALMIAVMGFNLLGDGIRDVLDPRARR
jgi:peptide/nickel transport system permease protein